MNIFKFLFRKKKTKNILNCYPEALLIVSKTGEIIFANDLFLGIMGVSGEQLENMDLYNIFDGGFNLVKELAKSNDSVVVRSKVKADSETFLELKASHYEDDEKKIVVSLRDVTNNQKMLNKLMFEHEYMNKLTKNKNAFLSKISGELTSPIHSINGFSQAILEGLGGDVTEKQEKYLKIINKNSTQLLDLVNNVIEYSKLESGLYSYEMKNFDFVNLMTALFSELKPIADEKKLVLNFDLNLLGKRMLYSDESLVKRVISGLVENAISTTDTGSVQVVVSHPDVEYLNLVGFDINTELPEKSHLLVTVRDTSDGLSESDMENIFDPYVNIEKYIAKKTVQKGLIMGTIFHLVRLLKGKIWVESETLKGSSFSFIIPVEKINM